MYLIDTSVWIDSLRQVDNGPARFFRSLVADRAPYGIAGVEPSLKCAPSAAQH